MSDMTVTTEHETPIASAVVEAPVQETAETKSLIQEPQKPVRLQSLDAFRGLTIFLMLLVNNIALDTATPSHLMHAPWNGGVHVADLVFPWFLFCVGAAIPFSAASFKRKGLPAWRLDLKIVTRAVILVLLGCLVDSSINHHLAFSLGVLQDIGLAYLVGAFLYDLPLTRRLIIASLMLIGYWGALKFLPVPGIGAGVFEDGRNFVDYFNKTYLDSLHLAGLLSMIPTGAMVLIGTAFGDLLRRREMDHEKKALLLFASGMGLIVLGTLWNVSLPYNKPVWTPSYIVLCAGAAAVMLSAFYYLIDLKGWSKWAFPLYVFGSNAILAYVAPILIKVLLFQAWRFPQPDGSTLSAHDAFLHSLKIHLGAYAGGFIYTLVYIGVCWLGLLLLYRKKIFVKV